MNERHTLSSLALQFALACDLCTVAYIISLSKDGVGQLFPLVLIPFAPLLYLLNLLFLRRERSMAALVILNGGSAIALFAAICVVDSFAHWTALMFVAIFCAWPASMAGQLALQPPKMYTLILCFDISAVLLILFTGYISISSLPSTWIIPIAAGCAAAFLGIVCRRSGHAPGVKDSILLLAAFGGLSLLLWLVMHFAAAPAGQGIVTLWTTLVAAVTFLVTNLWRVFTFLLSLLPSGEYEELPMENAIPSVDMSEMQQGSDSVLGMVLAVAVAVFLVIAGIWVLLNLRQVKLGGKRTIKSSSLTNRERLSLLRALGQLLERMKRRLRTELYLRRERSRPAGLFCILVRRCRFAPWHKQSGETPREFLTRLKLSSSNDNELAAALDELSTAVEQSLYAPNRPAAPFPKAALVRRRVGSAARRQYLRDLKTSIKRKLTPSQKQNP